MFYIRAIDFNYDVHLGLQCAADQDIDLNINISRDPQLFVENNHPIYGTRPYTQQSRGCGEPGDYIALPFTFLTTWNNTWEKFGDPAKLFVKEWSKLRYGIFDEFGFNGDPLYPNFYKWNGQLMPTGTTDAPLNGGWFNGKDHKTRCNPQMEANCYFFPIGANDHVTCSLGYLHYLPRDELTLRLETKYVLMR